MQFEDIFLDTVDSTQEYAKKNAKKFDKNKITCVLASEQTSGKGRFNRKWLSPTGNIYLTFYFQLPKKSLHLTSIGHILALSLVDVLREDKTLDPKIKWPNDVMLNQKKIAGILCEMSFQGDIANIFLGIGINVNVEKDFLESIDKPATSLKEETKKDIDKKVLFESLKQKFSKNLEIFKEKGFAAFHEKFENLLLFKGSNIKFFDGEKEYKGVLHSINCEGKLNLYLPNKEIKTFSAGDII